MEMGWRWDFAYEILPQMLVATFNTIVATRDGIQFRWLCILRLQRTVVIIISRDDDSVNR